MLFLIIPIYHYQEVASNVPSLKQEHRGNYSSNYVLSIKQKEYNINYISHSSIQILTDNDFGNFSSSGIGTHYDPFIIENYNITTNDARAINVVNTTRYFVIRNCLLCSSGFGIYLFNVSAGTCVVENNICSNTNHIGIWGKYSKELSITSNTCSRNHFNGILLKEGCNYSTITNNICKHNLQGGIIVEHSLNCQIADNILIENSYSNGIEIYYSHNSIIRNNTCINNELAGIMCSYSNFAIIDQNYAYSENDCSGIAIGNSISVSVLNNTSTSERDSLSVHQSPEIKISYNHLFGSGLEIADDYYENYIDSVVCGNFVNNYKLGFFLNLKRFNFDEPIYGQIIIINGYKIKIRNQLNTAEFCGIALFNCEKVTISNLKLISYNYINRYAIRIVSSKNIDVINTICINWIKGIDLQDSEDILIKSNLIENNSFCGIWIIESNRTSLVNNTCRENQFGGIYLIYSDECKIKYNNIINNNHYDYTGYPGLRLDFSDYNIIHHNNFIDNQLDGSPQAMDFGINNTWFEESTKEGNYYSDWSGSEPYSILSWTNVTDPYPLAEPTIYTEPPIFAIGFSVILILPIIVTSIVQLVLKRKKIVG